MTLSSNERLAIVKYYDSDEEVPNEVVAHTDIAFHNRNVIKSREASPNINRMYFLKFTTEEELRGPTETAAEVKPLGEGEPTIPVADDITLRRWCAEQAIIMLSSSKSSYNMGDVIRKAAGLYSFITRGQANSNE